MKKIVYTQRVEIVADYGERWDCADQQIPAFLRACGFLPVPVMNIPSLAEIFCREMPADGILLTGGNDLVSYGGNAPERDETERILIEYALRHDIPLFGICRGTQMIADYFGEHLEKTEDHVRRMHPVRGIIGRDAVNSYHNKGLRTVGPSWEILAESEDGVAEAVRHRHSRVAGIMWHPERMVPFSQEDVELTAGFFNGGILT